MISSLPINHAVAILDCSDHKSISKALTQLLLSCKGMLKLSKLVKLTLLRSLSDPTDFIYTKEE